MDRLRSAVAWSGTDVTLSMFVVSRHPAVTLPEPVGTARPHHVRTYELEDEDDVLGGRGVHEYDLVWQDIPAGLHQIVTAWLVAALEHGAVVAWFGFEGSFDFDHLLHPDIAGQIYAVAVGESVKLALDDEYRLSDDWRDLLAELRARVQIR